MLEHDYIKNKLQVDIETIIQSLDYDIEVNGEVGFYDHSWIKKKFGTLVTPFVLNPITTTISEDTLKLETRTIYSGGLCFLLKNAKHGRI